MNTRNYLHLSILISLSTALISCTGNWPQFRGPDSNMLANGKNLPVEWGNEQNIKWKIPLEGRGWSCPITWGDRIFLTEAILDLNSLPEDTVPPEQRIMSNPQDAVYRWMVYCIDSKTGGMIWERLAFEGKPGRKIHRDNTYASETPATDGKRVFAHFGMTGLVCYDFNGERIWEKDLGNFKAQSNWGTSTSPVLYKNHLYIQIDNQEESFLVALNKKTGEEAWRVTRDEKTNYSTPIIWKNLVRTELVTGGQKARSYDPETGRLIWELDLGGGRNISSSVASKELLFTGNEPRRGSGGTLFAVKAGAEGNITPAEGDSVSNGVLWSRPNTGLSMPSLLLYKGYIYILSRRGEICCYEASTGKEVYAKTKIPDAAAFWATPWAYDDRIWCLDEKGTTHAVKAGEKFEVMATHRIEDKFWSSPAITRSAYIFRGVSNLYCIE
jgi:outer membrane protein assembly factor BamB